VLEFWPHLAQPGLDETSNTSNCAFHRPAMIFHPELQNLKSLTREGRSGHMLTRAQSRSTYLNSVCYFYAPKAYNLALPGSGLPSKCSLEMNWWIYRGDWHLPTQSRNSMRGEDSHGCVTPADILIYPAHLAKQTLLIKSKSTRCVREELGTARTTATPVTPPTTPDATVTCSPVSPPPQQSRIFGCGA
jgi:hypothetical protein